MACNPNKKGRVFQGGILANKKTNATRSVSNNQSISKNVLVQFAAQYP